jgi:hypothetical protein
MQSGDRQNVGKTRFVLEFLAVFVKGSIVSGVETGSDLHRPANAFFICLFETQNDLFVSVEATEFAAAETESAKGLPGKKALLEIKATAIGRDSVRPSKTLYLLRLIEDPPEKRGWGVF